MKTSRIFHLFAGLLVAALWVPAGAGAASGAGEEGFTLSGPYAHLNLQVFLVHGPQRIAKVRYMTLTEAMAKKLVVVHETGSVQELAIENKGQVPVFIQSGDIVKGGRQDRVLRSDMIVPPRSGKIPLASFCVESGRWSQRGGESAGKFASNSEMVSSRELRLAAKHVQDQGAVWHNVAEQQKKLSSNLRLMRGDSSLDVRSAKSASSLQLTLENKELREMAEEYTGKLKSVLDGKKDVVGFAFAINGEVNNADLYGRSDLFRDLWPKLLRSAVVEAISEYKQPEPAGPAEAAARGVRLVGAISTMLAKTLTGKAETRDPSGRTRLKVRETSEFLLFETLDRKLADAWVHRNFIKKGPAPVRPPRPAPDQLQNDDRIQQRIRIDSPNNRNEPAPQQQKRSLP